MKKIRVELVFKWYDLWIGFFYDTKKKWLYILPFPCIGVVIKFKPEKKAYIENHWLYPDETEIIYKRK